MAKKYEQIVIHSHAKQKEILNVPTSCLSDRLCVVKCSPSAPAGLHVNSLKNSLHSKSHSFLDRMTKNKQLPGWKITRARKSIKLSKV